MHIGTCVCTSEHMYIRAINDKQGQELKDSKDRCIRGIEGMKVKVNVVIRV